MRHGINDINGFIPSPPLTGRAGPWYGVYPAVVTAVDDPDGQGRVRVRLPWTTDPDNQAYDSGSTQPSGGAYEPWARIATLMAGTNRGTWFIPEPNDEVMVSFLGGDPRLPVVVGALWNGVDTPPEQADRNNNIRSITSRSGIRVTFDDTDGGVQFTIDTPGGQQVVCKDAPASIKMTDSSGNQVTLESSGITLNSSANVNIKATTLNISASMVTVDSGMSKFSGVVHSDTHITNTTVSATYTPGAGNIW
jgi:uncharacterized protein involved in type VI secretion and phage assembly